MGSGCWTIWSFLASMMMMIRMSRSTAVGFGAGGLGDDGMVLF